MYEQLDIFSDSNLPGLEYYPELDLSALYRFAQEQSQLHWQREFTGKIDLVNSKWRRKGGSYHPTEHKIKLSLLTNKVISWEIVQKVLLHELVHWHMHTSGQPYGDEDIEFASECMRVGALISATKAAKHAAAIVKAKMTYAIGTFDEKLKEIVMDAVSFLGYSAFLDETTEIAIKNFVTSDSNKYFPPGCAVISVELCSDKATGSLTVCNEYAIKNHLDWVEFRGYDHRYFKEYYHCLIKHEERVPPIYPLEDIRRLHFSTKSGETFFSTPSLELIEKYKRDFFEWGFGQ